MNCASSWVTCSIDNTAVINLISMTAGRSWARTRRCHPASLTAPQRWPWHRLPRSWLPHPQWTWRRCGMAGLGLGWKKCVPFLFNSMVVNVYLLHTEASAVESAITLKNRPQSLPMSGMGKVPMVIVYNNSKYELSYLIFTKVVSNPYRTLCCWYL